MSDDDDCWLAMNTIFSYFTLSLVKYWNASVVLLHRNDNNFRMAPEALYSLIKSLHRDRRSIIACVVVIGATEVSDEIVKILF